MHIRGFMFALVVSVCLGLGCGGGGAPVRNPDPMAATGDPDTTQQAILDALPKRRWTAEDVQPGRIVAFLPVRSFLVRVEITYDQSAVRIAYLNSDNLGAREGKDGQVYAHPNVNKWLRNLAVDISQSLAKQPLATPATSGGALPASDASAAPAAPAAQPVAPVPVAPN
jgi:hypothetical protein